VPTSTSHRLEKSGLHIRCAHASRLFQNGKIIELWIWELKRNTITHSKVSLGLSYPDSKYESKPGGVFSSSYFSVLGSLSKRDLRSDVGAERGLLYLICDESRKYAGIRSF
jgi:hypothetical protein